LSKISQVCGRSKTFTIEGIELEFKSNYVNLDDLPSLMVISDQSVDSLQRAEKTKEIAYKVLKKVISDASDEEIKEFCLRNLKAIIEAVVEMSGMKNADTN
jgi:hypothetical protein